MLRDQSIWPPGSAGRERLEVLYDVFGWHLKWREPQIALKFRRESANLRLPLNSAASLRSAGTAGSLALSAFNVSSLLLLLLILLLLLLLLKFINRTCQLVKSIVKLNQSRIKMCVLSLLRKIETDDAALISYGRQFHIAGASSRDMPVLGHNEQIFSIKSKW